MFSSSSQSSIKLSCDNIPSQCTLDVSMTCKSIDENNNHHGDNDTCGTTSSVDATTDGVIECATSINCSTVLSPFETSSYSPVHTSTGVFNCNTTPIGPIVTTAPLSNSSCHSSPSTSPHCLTPPPSDSSSSPYALHRRQIEPRRNCNTNTFVHPNSSPSYTSPPSSTSSVTCCTLSSSSSSCSCSPNYATTSDSSSSLTHQIVNSTRNTCATNSVVCKMSPVSSHPYDNSPSHSFNPSNHLSSYHLPSQSSFTHPIIYTHTQLLNSRGEYESKLSAEEAESKKRREVLERRPSYRKILNELSDVSGIAAHFASSDSVIKNELSASATDHSHSHSQQQQSTTGNIVNASASSTGSSITVAPSYLKVLPSPATIQIAPASQEAHSLSTLPAALAVANPNASASSASSPGTIVQYTGQDAHGFFVPVTVSHADLQTYQIRTGSNSAHISSGAMMTNPSGQGEEATKKRELRLQKNREAAKECRRKKKEYIKCLENRVAVLENQNKALIEELKSLKELYCAKGD